MEGEGTLHKFQKLPESRKSPRRAHQNKSIIHDLLQVFFTLLTEEAADEHNEPFGEFQQSSRPCFARRAPNTFTNPAGQRVSAGHVTVGDTRKQDSPHVPLDKDRNLLKCGDLGFFWCVGFDTEAQRLLPTGHLPSSLEHGRN